ncbi:MAG: HIT family protein [Clostridia bacterium]
MENCIYCTKKEIRESLMFKVCDLPYSEVFLMCDQWHPGRCVVTYSGGHVTEYFHLTPEQNAGYFADVTKVAKAIDEIYAPDRINILSHGDNMKHLHMHLCPKRKDQESWRKSFFGLFPEAFLTDEEYASAVAALKAKLIEE